MLNEAIILAGGLGTRLRTAVNDRPKPMAQINDRPFLEYLLDHLIEKGITRFIFSIGFKSNYISNYFLNNYKNCEIVYAIEEYPLGTGGAIKNAMSFLKSKDFLVANGDSLFLVDIQQQYRFHLNKKADVTLALKHLSFFDRYGTVILNEHSRVLNFYEKKTTKQGLINGGVYIFNVNAFKKVELPQKFSIENDFFQSYVNHLNLYGFKSEGYFLDIGIPEDFAKAQNEFKNFTTKNT